MKEVCMIIDQGEGISAEPLKLWSMPVNGYSIVMQQIKAHPVAAIKKKQNTFRIQVWF